MSMKQYLLALGLTMSVSLAYASTVTMNLTAEQGNGKLVGTISVVETPYGLLFEPNLHGLTPGVHGFHLHQNPACGENGMAAGSHFDPKNTGKHLGPYNDAGHLGDLPALYVDNDGSVTIPVLAPRLKHLKELSGHSLMVHNGGDNYSDEPQKLGGGDGRMVCGVVE